MSDLPKTFQAMRTVKINSPLEPQDVPLRQLDEGEVLVKVLACGLCQSDVSLSKGIFGDDFLPRTQGHEVVGDVVAVGAGVTRVSVGNRVGGGWNAGYDGTCKNCISGLFQICDVAKVNGFSFDGGFAKYVILQAKATTLVPDGMDPVQAAPLFCAGVTAFNGLRKMHVEQGATVAVHGLGGLGHLAVQFASRMGYRVIVISSSPSKRDLAMSLGAHEFIDLSSQDAVAILKSRGGVDLLCTTTSTTDSISSLLYAIRNGGKMLLLTAAGNVPFDTTYMAVNAISVCGWAAGHFGDVEDTLKFAHEHDIKCMVEKYPLEKINEAIADLKANKPRFRAVLVNE